jgi:hypothetical protein
MAPSEPGDPGGSWRAPVRALLDRAPLLGLAVIVAAVLVIVGLVLANARMPATAASEVPSGVATPPVGTIWFGSGLDAQSFELSGRSDQAATGTTVTAVARLAQPMTDGEANVVVGLKGTTLSSMPLHLAGSGTHDLVSWTFALPVAGTFQITVDGPDGTTLASGSITAQ